MKSSRQYHLAQRRYRMYLRTAIFAGALTATVSEAQQSCFPRDRVAQLLTGTYGESPASAGLDAAGNIVETWANRKSGDWTLFVTTPEGVSCLVGSGSDWQEYEPEAAGVDG